MNRNLQSQDALLSSVESAGIAARVINTPTAFIEDADGNVTPGTIERINDQMAELVAKHPGKLYGLATVDAFSGDAGAREVTRAVKELKLAACSSKAPSATSCSAPRRRARRLPPRLRSACRCSCIR